VIFEHRHYKVVWRVATRLRYGRIFYYRLTTNLLVSLSVKEFRYPVISQYLAKLETKM